MSKDANKDANRDADIRFEFELESIEVDVPGWLNTVFREHVVRPLAGIVEPVGARAYGAAASIVRTPYLQGRRS